MMSSVFARRTLLASRPTAQRFFSSSLLVPMSAKAEVPAEVQSTPMSDAAHETLLANYAAFNEQCQGELQEMNKNIIENIVARGGTDGWDTQVEAMKKSFEFDSFEECQAFIMRVAKDAEAKDHHPEWSLSNGGKTVDVRLTSHFAGNTVTRLDFELAEAMNTANDEIRSGFKMYPMFTPEEWSSIKIGLGLFVFGSFAFKFMTGTNYEQKTIAAGPLPDTKHVSPVGEHSAVQAFADESARVEVVDYAYGEYERRDNERPVPGV